jgi:hypothetical protein
MKKNLLLLVLLFVVVQLGCAQMDVYDYKREQLKGYKKVIQTRINYSSSSDSSISETIYHVNPLGEIIKYEHYDTSLSMWANFDYDTNGKLIAEEVHRPGYIYDEKIKDDVRVWEEDTYEGILYTYLNGRLIEKRIYYSDEGEVSNRSITYFKYDKYGRIVKDMHIDLFMGFTGTFHPNTDSLTSMNFKEESDTSQTLYSYRKDSLIETSIDRDKEVTYAYSKLNSAGLPIKTVWKDKKGNLIMVSSYIYDKKGKLLVRKQEFIDINRIKFDYTTADEEKIVYLANGLPYQSLSYDKDGTLLSRTIVKYE